MVLLTTAPKHRCIMATSCHVAQCIRHTPWHKSPLLRGNIGKTSSESLRITALVWKRLFFQFSRVMLSRPLAFHFALLWMLPTGPKSAARSRNSTPATQMLSRLEKLFCMSYMQTPVHIFQHNIYGIVLLIHSHILNSCNCPPVFCRPAASPVTLHFDLHSWLFLPNNNLKLVLDELHHIYFRSVLQYTTLILNSNPVLRGFTSSPWLVSSWNFACRFYHPSH